MHCKYVLGGKTIRSKIIIPLKMHEKLTRGVLFFIKRTCNIYVKYRRHLSITSNMLPVAFISYITGIL